MARRDLKRPPPPRFLFREAGGSRRKNGDALAPFADAGAHRLRGELARALGIALDHQRPQDAATRAEDRPFFNLLLRDENDGGLRHQERDIQIADVVADEDRGLAKGNLADPPDRHPHNLQDSRRPFPHRAMQPVIGNAALGALDAP